jgi:ribosomal protein L27
MISYCIVFVKGSLVSVYAYNGRGKNDTLQALVNGLIVYKGVKQNTS